MCADANEITPSINSSPLEFPAIAKNTSPNKENTNPRNINLKYVVVLCFEYVLSVTYAMTRNNKLVRVLKKTLMTYNFIILQYVKPAKEISIAMKLNVEPIVPLTYFFLKTLYQNASKKYIFF